MKLVSLDSLFDVRYGSNLELNALIEDDAGINFVSRTSKNNGVSAKVRLIEGLQPIPAGVLTVAGGGSVLETFLQSEPFYSGRDLYYLTPIVEMTVAQKLFYAKCISSNRYKYSYGRQANKTLKTLLIPSIDNLPGWVNQARVELPEQSKKPLNFDIPPVLQTNNWKPFLYSELFSIERGESVYLKNTATGTVPYVSASATNNGITAYVDQKNQNGNAISLAYDGSVGEAFYQPSSFLASEKIAVLKIHHQWEKQLNQYIAMFLITLIRKEKYRYNYGLKWSVNSRMLSSIIKLPVKGNGSPDFDFMESYIKSLPYSSII